MTVPICSDPPFRKNLQQVESYDLGRQGIVAQLLVNLEGQFCFQSTAREQEKPAGFITENSRVPDSRAFADGHIPAIDLG